MTIATDPTTWRLSTPGGIPYKLVSVSGQFSEEDSSATETIIIRANRLWEFAREVFPAPWVAIGGLFYPPRRRFPGLSPLIAKRFTWDSNVDGKPIDPFGTDISAPDNTYDGDIRVTIEYGTTPSNDQDPDQNDPTTFLEVEASAASSFLNPPIRGDSVWERVDATDPIGNVPVREADVPAYNQVESIIEWSVRWSQIPQSYFTGTLINRLRNAQGLVNSAVMPMFINSPVDTILFTTWSVKQQFTWRTGASGQPPIQLEMQFIDKNFTAQDDYNETTLGNPPIQVTHNHFFRPGSGYRRLLFDGVNTAFRSTNLNTIFLP